MIQEKYGYAREKAQQEVEGRLKEYGDTMNGPSGNGKPDAAPHEGARGDRHGDDRRSGWGGIGARRHRHGDDRRSSCCCIVPSAFNGIGGLVPAREKIRRDGNRPHRLDTPLPRPSFWLGWASAISWPDSPRGKSWTPGLPSLQRRAWRALLGGIIKDAKDLLLQELTLANAQRAR